MSEFIKNYSAPYTFNSVNYPDPLTINSGTVYINGNLIVSGSTTEIEANILEVFDNKIIVNYIPSTVPPTPPTLDAFFINNRGTEPDVAIKWNETLDVWQLTNDGVTYGNIAVQSFVPFITAVVEDTSPQLGNNLDVNGFTITGNVVINPTTDLYVETPMKLKAYSGSITVDPGYTTISSGTPDSGDTGVYVSNGVVTDEELITASKALVYALIL